jgi:hypothetical protein
MPPRTPLDTSSISPRSSISHSYFNGKRRDSRGR